MEQEEISACGGGGAMQPQSRDVLDAEHHCRSISKCCVVEGVVAIPVRRGKRYEYRKDAAWFILGLVYQ